MAYSMHLICLLLRIFVYPTSSLPLPLCSNVSDSPILCAKFSNYSKLEYPEPLPAKIRATFAINDIINIDESLQIISVLLTLNLKWTDERILWNVPAQNKPK